MIKVKRKVHLALTSGDTSAHDSDTHHEVDAIVNIVIAAISGDSKYVGL